MKTITVGENQTIYDLAAQYYGTTEAVGEILELNPGIHNDGKSVNVDLSEFWFDLPVAAGSVLNIDDSSYLMDKNVVRRINENVTTWEPWQEQ